MLLDGMPNPRINAGLAIPVMRVDQSLTEELRPIGVSNRKIEVSHLVEEIGSAHPVRGVIRAQ